MSIIIEIREYTAVEKLRYIDSRIQGDSYINDVQNDLAVRLVNQCFRFCEFQAQEDKDDTHRVIIGAKLVVCPPDLSDNVIRQQLLKLEDIKDNRRRGKETYTWL